tara:strand:+ start:2131 stop:2562 length:432 start_codon:yes stop_codon:yes gene_type:complete
MKTKHGQKLVFLFLLILGNAIMGILTFSEERPTPATSKPSWNRPNYIRMRVSAELRAELNPKVPVVLVAEKSHNIIRDVFILKKYKKEPQPEDFLSKKSTDVFLVSLPKKHIQKVLNRESFTIFPHGIELRKTQRKKNYEISY